MKILEGFEVPGKLLYNYDYFISLTTEFQIIIYLVVQDNEVVKYQVKNKWHLLYEPCNLTFPDNIVLKSDPAEKLPEHYLGTYWPGARTFTFNKNYTGPFKGVYENLRV